MISKLHFHLREKKKTNQTSTIASHLLGTFTQNTYMRDSSLYEFCDKVPRTSGIAYAEINHSGQLCRTNLVTKHAQLIQNQDTRNGICKVSHYREQCKAYESWTQAYRWIVMWEREIERLCMQCPQYNQTQRSYRYVVLCPAPMLLCG